jgi:transcriptional regulator with XRE-family HTH domain
LVLRSLRLAAGMTRTALGRAAGVPEGRITAYEERGHKPHRATRRKLAAALGAPEIAPKQRPAPDWGRRRLAARLRRQGLTFRQIGARMGISHQSAWDLVRHDQKARRRGERPA